MMECAICHKKELSKTRCVEGHYVCNECHTAGMDAIIGLCLNEMSSNPVAILEKMMGQPFCHMHGPEHHVMVGSALLTAYKNAGGDRDVRIDHIKIHAAVCQTLCSIPSDDGKSAGANRHSWWAALLQAGLLSFHSGSSGFCERAFFY